MVTVSAPCHHSHWNRKSNHMKSQVISELKNEFHLDRCQLHKFTISLMSTWIPSKGCVHVWLKYFGPHQHLNSQYSQKLHFRPALYNLSQSRFKSIFTFWTWPEHCLHQVQTVSWRILIKATITKLNIGRNKLYFLFVACYIYTWNQVP